MNPKTNYRHLTPPSLRSPGTPHPAAPASPHPLRKRESRPRGYRAVEQLEAGLNTKDEASWYAERLEQLGQVIFGDLWRTDVAKNASDRKKLL